MKLKTTLVVAVYALLLLCGIAYATPYTKSDSRYTVNDTTIQDSSGSVEGDTNACLGDSSIAVSTTASTALAGIIAVETWQNTHTNDSISTNAHGHWSDLWYTVATAGNYNFDFTIMGGELSMADKETTSHPPDRNSILNVDIVLNGYSIWESDNMLHGNNVTHSYTTTGTDIGGTEFYTTSTSGLHEFGITFGEYSETLLLGYYEVGDRINLHYSMVASTRNDHSDEAYVYARGDMFGNINYNADSPAPVPEPATLLLMGTGLLGLIGSKHKKFNRK